MIELVLAVILDFLLGDPIWLPHPVRLMGRIIQVQEKMARRIGKTPGALKAMGLMMVIVNIILAIAVPVFLIGALDGMPWMQGAVKVFLMYTMLAARNLSDEATKVSRALGESLQSGRKRLSHIVGRDTENLSGEEVIRATVETVAENTSDGVIAPLLYMMVFGLPGGFVYKFANTMDSMVGYKDEKYGDLGYYPAKVDDLLNLVPARLTAILMIFSSPLGTDRRKAFQIVARDSRNHKSPNSGYPESAVAGILSIQLGGDSSYRGLVVQKPTIGDKVNSLDQLHIEKAIKIMYRAEILLVFIFVVVKTRGLW